MIFQDWLRGIFPHESEGFLYIGDAGILRVLKRVYPSVSRYSLRLSKTAISKGEALSMVKLRYLSSDTSKLWMSQLGLSWDLIHGRRILFRFSISFSSDGIRIEKIVLCA